MPYLQGPPCEAPEASKELTITQTVMVPCEKPPIEQILESCIDVEVKEATIIQTKIVTEGEVLRKVIVTGKIEVTIKYVGAVLDQQVHAVVFCLPFETLIEWPGGPLPGAPICVVANVEHFQIEELDPKILLLVLVLRLDAFRQ